MRRSRPGLGRDMHIIRLMYVIQLLKDCELDFQVWILRLTALVPAINIIQLGSRGLYTLTDYVLIEYMKDFVWIWVRI